MEFLPEYDDLIRVLVAIGCGSVIGVEREIKNKAAGFRTVVLICLGAAVFTMMSRFGNMSDDRIAANIITGIGFIGAGVIFKGKVSVQGLTTAAVIWMAAGIGMVAGSGYFSFAFTLTVLTLLILIVFGRLEMYFAAHYWRSTLSITFESTDVANFATLQGLAEKYGVSAKRKTVSKNNGKLAMIVEISGRRTKIAEFNNELLASDHIKEFFYS